VDLHIEKLTNNPHMYSTPEILAFQLSEFEKYYDLARAHKLREFTVIHGVGEGKLKQEIHERLKGRPEVSSFVNRHHPLYGFGATQIYFN
jgi:dsDNA-specific endonuclease/ATPase MutS2